MNKVLAGFVVAVGFTAGCTSYYQVTDPTTGRAYYTTDLDQNRSGSATLTDARTGNKVNLQNTEVKKISKEEFEAGKFTQPAPIPARTTPEGAPAPAGMSGQPDASGTPTAAPSK